jgi:hypothetical protein
MVEGSQSPTLKDKKEQRKRRARRLPKCSLIFKLLVPPPFGSGSHRARFEVVVGGC